MSSRTYRTRLTTSDLHEFTRDHVQAGLDVAADYSRAFYLSGDIVCNFLRVPWVRDHVFDTAGSFIRRQDEPDLRSTVRLGRMANALFDLQHVPGFDAKLESWRTMDPESFFAELDGAHVLWLAGVEFEFVSETGRKGDDYDVLIEPAGRKVCGELKCRAEIKKSEIKKIDVEGLVNTLDKARKQVPADRPAIVFVRVPETWATDPTFEITAKVAMSKTFRRSGRIRGVVLTWEEFTEAPTGGGLCTVMRLSFGNPRQGDVDVVDILEALQVNKRTPFSVFDFTK